MHDNNIFHGNLKPNNVLLDKDYKVYISDWEFTNKINSHKDDELYDEPLYSEGYVAPEQIN